MSLFFLADSLLAWWWVAGSSAGAAGRLWPATLFSGSGDQFGCQGGSAWVVAESGSTSSILHRSVPNLPLPWMLLELLRLKQQQPPGTPQMCNGTGQKAGRNYSLT